MEAQAENIVEEVMEDEAIEDEPIATAEEIEFAQTTARYEEVLSKCRLLRARLLLTSANFSESSSSNEATPLETLDVMDSLDQMEAKVQRLSIHEEMLKEVKVSKLALELADSDGPHEVLDELLKEHCANQAKLFELAQEISKETVAQREAMGQHLDRLCEYTASLKNDQLELSKTYSSNDNSSSNLKLKKSVEKQIKEIRFMQVCISSIVNNKDVDLRKEKTIREILKSVRNPITSVEDFL